MEKVGWEFNEPVRTADTFSFATKFLITFINRRGVYYREEKFLATPRNGVIL